MIDELHVRNVALIEDATLVPARGLTVITGETGAGKTALLSALKLLVGERAEASMVREGAERASVEGRVYADAAGEQAVGEADAAEAARGARAEAPRAADAEGTVVARTLSADGRSRVHIDGAIGSVKQLASLVGQTVDLCGQHEHQRLMKASNHRAMLDAWQRKSLEPLLADYRAKWEKAKAAAEKVESIIAAGKLGSETVEQARYVCRRIDEVDPGEGEYEKLIAQLPLLENAEALLAATGEAHQMLSGEAGALDAIGQAVGALDGMAERLGQAAASLREATYIVEDVSREVRAYADGVEYDPSALAHMQERASQLQALMRTWGPTMQEVFEARDQARETVSALDDFEKNLEKARKEWEAAEEDLAKAARNLHDARGAAAPSFADAVVQQMGRLELGSARLVCSVEELERRQWTANGPDAVEFLFQPGSALQARPLSKIASGGEISRVMLAVKVALGHADSVSTLVFDEVDAGVGGATARSLAAVLADLATTHQVMVVTHLPQVAVHAQAHYVVRKSAGEHPVTTLEQVKDESREREIARMLSGEETQASLAHARELLAEAESA